MSGSEIPECPQCGRKPTFGATYCPYCGTRLSSARQPVTVAPIPERRSLSGPCAVLVRDRLHVPIAQVGRIIAKALGQPLGDVTREIRVNRGFLARQMPAAEAVALAEKLEAIGLGVLVLPEASVGSLPEADRMKSASFSEAGLDCIAYRWDSTEEIHAPWASILLASCARVEKREVRQVASRDEDGDRGEKGGLLKITPPHKIPKLETNVRLEFVIDIFLQEPRRRLRMDENTCAYALVDIGSFTGGGAEYYRAARNLLRYGRGVALNPGVRLLAENAPQEAWAELTFETKHEFDMYNLWLLQLLRFGLPVPE